MFSKSYPFVCFQLLRSTGTHFPFAFPIREAPSATFDRTMACLFPRSRKRENSVNLKSRILLRLSPACVGRLVAANRYVSPGQEIEIRRKLSRSMLAASLLVTIPGISTWCNNAERRDSSTENTTRVGVGRFASPRSNVHSKLSEYDSATVSEEDTKNAAIHNADAIFLRINP